MTTVMVRSKPYRARAQVPVNLGLSPTCSSALSAGARSLLLCFWSRIRKNLLEYFLVLHYCGL